MSSTAHQKTDTSRRKLTHSSNALASSSTLLVGYTIFALITAIFALIAPTTAQVPSAHRHESMYEYDVIIYGGTSAAIAAAIQVTRMNKTVAIVCQDRVLGGLTASGLGWTDSKDGNMIGGLAREFYEAVYAHYLKDSAWTMQTRALYLSANIQAQPGPAIDDANKIQWTLEPSVAQMIFATWLSENKIPAFTNEWLDRDTPDGVTKAGAKITAIRTVSGKVFKGLQFIDAGYEGDLMAASEIHYDVGRDSEERYNEPLAGVRLNTATNPYNGVIADPYDGVDPYIVKGNSSSGLIAGIQDTIPVPLPAGFTGAADSMRMQSFNFRLCLTRQAGNKVEFFRPTNYNVEDYELLLRLFEGGHSNGFTTQLMPNYKTDSNSVGPFSFDFIGGNFDVASHLTYTEATYEQRAAMVQRHKDYQMGFLYTITNSDRIPAQQRAQFAEWGLAKDEFVDNDNWPHQLYIREARRMRGMYTLVQPDEQIPPGYIGGPVVGMGTYSLDSHVVRRVVYCGKIYDEGGFYVYNAVPYPIPYLSIVPMKQDATNFLNPITLSASHVAFGSVRMEPTYMILGQSAGIAAVLAIEKVKAVQDLDGPDLIRVLRESGQRIAG